MSNLSPEHLNRLQDPDFICEGIGPDGFQYPDAVMYKTSAGRFEYDNETLKRIGQMAAEYAKGNQEAAQNCGELILGNLIKYTNPEK